MAYQMAATALTSNDFDGHSPVAGLFKCNPSNIDVAFYTISTNSVLTRFLCISRASCRSAVLLLYHYSETHEALVVYGRCISCIVSSPPLSLSFFDWHVKILRRRGLH